METSDNQPPDPGSGSPSEEVHTPVADACESLIQDNLDDLADLAPLHATLSRLTEVETYLVRGYDEDDVNLNHEDKRVARKTVNDLSAEIRRRVRDQLSRQQVRRNKIKRK